jgi:flavin-binding protein dodecin
MQAIALDRDALSASILASLGGGLARQGKLRDWRHAARAAAGWPVGEREPSRTDQARAEREAKMSEPVYKVVEIVGTSEQSISKAIDNAVAKAAGTLRRLGWFEVGQIRGNIADGKVHHHQVTLKVGFTLE